MAFEIKGSRKLRTGRYEFVVKGPDEEWGLREMLPYLTRASQADKNYRLVFDFAGQQPIQIVHRKRHRMQATLTLEGTVSSGTKILKISSTGISPGKINYFVTHLEADL